MTNKSEISLPLLVDEYTHWLVCNGSNRNSDDLRFGQYIHSKYDLTDVFGPDDDDAFYTESAGTAFQQIAKKL